MGARASWVLLASLASVFLWPPPVVEALYWARPAAWVSSDGGWEGTLHFLDARAPGGARYRDVRVPIEAGERVAVQALSAQVGVQVTLMPNASVRERPVADATMALSMTATADTVAVLRVSTGGRWEAGLVELRLSRGDEAAREGTMAGALQMPSEAVAGARPAERIEASSQVDRRLEAGALRRSHGQLVDRYIVRLERGRPVTISLDSEDFDAQLFVVFPNHGGEENDDISPDNRNARVSFYAPVTGDYAIFVSSYRRDEEGAYRLGLREERVEGGPPLSALRGMPRGAVLEEDVEVHGRLASREGASEGALLRDGSMARRYHLPVRQGQRWRLELKSEDFDAYLLAIGGDGLVLVNDDRHPQTTDAQLEFTAEENEELQVVVSTFLPGMEGAYGLVARRVESVSDLNEVAPEESGRVVALTIGVSTYPAPEIPDLPFCAEDAVKIRDALMTSGAFAPESVVLTNAAATREAVYTAFAALRDVVTERDVFVLFFSGHGGQTPSDDARELDGLAETLVLADGQIRDDELAELVLALESRLTVVALDACYSGGFRAQLLQRKNVVGIFSSEEDVSSMVAEEFQAGGYLAHILAGAFGEQADQLPRDGQISVDELLQYIRREWATTGLIPSQDRALRPAHQNLVIERGYTSPQSIVLRKPEPLR